MLKLEQDLKSIKDDYAIVYKVLNNNSNNITSSLYHPGEASDSFSHDGYVQLFWADYENGEIAEDDAEKLRKFINRVDVDGDEISIQIEY